MSLPKRSKNSPLTFILYNKIFIKVNECPSNNLHHENLSSNYKPITNNLSNELISSLVQNLSLSSSSKTVNSIQIDENIKSYIDEQINIKFKSIEERILSIEAALKK